ncbi:MAG TPA: glycosyltransferase family 2 protein [Thermoanaerobaculia bacterium]|nr:glycosyltransferase family 2 protein [Thermoanaerobaculia bacterium]
MSRRPDRVSVALLSWNGRQHLATCLAALRAQDDPGVPWEVLVLDNGSTDGTAEWVRAHHPEVRLLPSLVNLGFCAGNNRVVAEAAGDAVAFLNNDTRPQPGWLAALVAAYAVAPADVAAVSGKIVDWAGERLDFGRGVMTFDGHAFQLDFRRPLARAEVPERGEELLFACGGNMLISKASFLEAGGFDADYFAYLEDVDLGWRLWAGGERITFVPDAVVNHRSSATSDLLGLYNRGFLFERNAFLTAYKNYEPGLWERVMPALLLTFLARTQAMLVGNNPGGETLRLDPYAGHIANTAPQGGASAPPPEPRTVANLARKLRDYGPREFARRGLRKLREQLAPPAAAIAPPAPPSLTDERTIAQLRALSYLLGNLDRAAAQRAAVQKRRRRSDREIFARFPPYLVPTYPGDAELFASPGFAAWLPEELPLVRKTLPEIMEWG